MYTKILKQHFRSKRAKNETITNSTEKLRKALKIFLMVNIFLCH